MNDGTVIWRSKGRERAEAAVTRLRPISPWLLILAVVVIVAVAWPLTVWLYGIAGNDPARRLEAAKIELTAAAGTVGALALLLAFRRQRATEIIAKETREAQEREHEQRDRAANANKWDAEQRRITDLYTKAADQLGSEKAPVRLAGLHALERLAQNTPDQRQTIVDVICAYLRMPYTPPDEQPPAEDAPAEAHTRYENRRQELQVRMTAQRILAAHLIPEEADRFWNDVGLDLREAHLHGLNLAGCHVKSASFDGAQFSGDAGFGGTRFDKEAVFSGARFDKKARFDEAQVGGDAVFSGARFGGDAGFREARFDRRASFDGAQVEAKASFDGARFGGDADFEEARFGGDADFDKAEFEGEADFNGAQFKVAFFGGAQFDGTTRFRSAQFDVVGNFRRARFCGRYTSFSTARFSGAQGSGEAGFGETQFSGEADFGGTRFGHDAMFSGARFDGDAFFHGALFDRNARFDGAQVGGAADFDEAKFDWAAVFRKVRFGGRADFMEAQFDEDANFQGAQARPRRHSWPEGWTTHDAQTTEGKQEGWVYLVRVESEGEQQLDRERPER